MRPNRPWVTLTSTAPVIRAPAFLSRAVVSRFRVYLMSQARVIGTTAGCHQLKVTSVTGLPDRAAAALSGCRNRRGAA
jgi:hypothetical protein